MNQMLATLARLIMPRQKAATEGAYRPGPYLVQDGFIPASWGQYLNFWQLGYNPLPFDSCSIVEACVWAYIRAIAQLPGYHKRELENAGTETVTSSALSRVLRAPNPYQTPSDFLVHLIRSLLLTGNSYWIAQRNDRSEVAALHWTDPRDCRVREIAIDGQAFHEVFYEISANPLLQFAGLGRDGLIIPARDVLHIKLATPRHPLVGETWLKALALELANRAAINAAQTTFAQNQSRPSGVLQTDLTLTKAQVDELRERWNEQSRGMNTGGVPILTSGLKFEGVSMSNEDAEIIEQMKLNDRTIAAVFGVPPLLIGLADTTAAKTAEAQMSEWLAAGLGYLINHIEVAFDKFFNLAEVPAGREWMEYDTGILLRSDFKTRMEGYARGMQAGVFAPNELRAKEGLQAVEAGDEPRVQQQMVPLSFASEPPAAPAAPPAPPPAEPADVPDDDQRALLAFHLRKYLDGNDGRQAAA